MPGGFGDARGLANSVSIGASYAAYNPIGTVLTPGGTAGTKGAWAQIGSATTSDAALLVVKLSVGFVTSSAKVATFDIGIGASGSQVVLINNVVLSGYGSYSADLKVLPIPLQLPSGTAIWARCSVDSVATGGSYESASVSTFDAGQTNLLAFQAIDTIGFVAGTSGGTAVSGTSGSKGSYVQLISATTEDYYGLIINYDCQGNQLGYFLSDVSVGSSGNEKIIIADDVTNLTQAGQITHSCLYDVFIPAGTRISARAATNAGSSSNIGVSLLGIY
jgi:hypothetical protein